MLDIQRTSSAFRTILLSLMVLYSSASSDVTDILESDQEQLNQLEKLRFDGKPVKIKRYRCLEEYIYLDENGNITAVEFTSSVAPLPIYEPFGETTGSSSGTSPIAAKTKTTESLPRMQTIFRGEAIA